MPKDVAVCAMASPISIMEPQWAGVCSGQNVVHKVAAGGVAGLALAVFATFADWQALMSKSRVCVRRYSVLFEVCFGEFLPLSFRP